MMKNTRVRTCTFLINPRNIRPALHIPITRKYATKRKKGIAFLYLSLKYNDRQPRFSKHINLNFTLDKTPGHAPNAAGTTSCHDPTSFDDYVVINSTTVMHRSFVQLEIVSTLFESTSAKGERERERESILHRDPSINYSERKRRA